jgi:photosystem II stability/assembly factor-like uncharacterized protein
MLALGLPGISVYAQGWQWQNPLPQGNTLYQMSIGDSLNYSCGGGAGTIVHSTDRGKTWKYITVGDSLFMIGVVFVHENMGIAIGEYLDDHDNNQSIILRTSDGGKTWSMQFECNSMSFNALSFSSPTNGVAVGSFFDIPTGLSYEAVAFTTDAGITWHYSIRNIEGSLRAVTFVDNSYGWASGSNATIYKTTDGGVTWASLYSKNYYYISAFHFVDRNNGWAIGDNSSDLGLILHTTDGGLTWSDQSTGDYRRLNDVYFVDTVHGWIASQGQQDTSGNYHSVMRTTNGGRTWTEEVNEYSGSLFGIRFLNRSDGFACGLHGAILSTNDSGLHWTNSTAGITANLTNVMFIDHQNGWALSHLNSSHLGQTSVIHTTDAGATWRIQSVLDSQRSTHLTFTDPLNGWITGDKPPLLRTTDGGNSWLPISIPGATALTGITFLDGQTGYIIGDGIWQTSDGGQVWTKQTVPVHGNYSLSDVSFSDKSNGIIIGQKIEFDPPPYCREYIYELIINTTDGGTTWVDQSSGSEIFLHSIDYLDSNNAWLIYSGYSEGGNLLHSTDGGKSWKVQLSLNHDRGTDDIQSVRFINPNDGWVIGSVGVILHTSNGGTTWTYEPSGTVNHLADCYFLDSATGYTVGEYGTILHTSTSGLSNVTQKNGNKGNNNTLQNFPNPFPSFTTIRYQVPQTSFVKIRIMNVLGEQIATLISEMEDSGTHETIWNASALPNGTYFCKITAGNYSSSLPIVLAK